MEDDSCVVVHLVEFIDAANATVGQDQGARLKDELLRLRVLRNVNCEADG